MIANFILLGCLVLVAISVDRILSKILNDQKEIVDNYVSVQKKLYEYKKQVEYFNSFLKDIKEIQKEQHYGSINNFQNKIRSAVDELENKLHFIK